MVSMVTAALNIKDNKYTLEVEFLSLQVFSNMLLQVPFIFTFELYGNLVKALHDMKLKSMFFSSHFVSSP